MIKINDYNAPEMEVYKFIVECGFAISNEQLPEYEEDDDEIILG